MQIFVVTCFFLVYRLEEKITDMESENKILRQQTLLTASKGSLTNPPAYATKVGFSSRKSSVFIAYFILSSSR